MGLMPIHRPWRGFLLALACLVLAFGCDESPQPAVGSAEGAEGPLRVAVSVQPHAWLVERVGGDKVRVVTLVPPGGSPHTFQPSDAEVTEAMRSAIFFRTGVAFERSAWFSAIRDAGSVEIIDLRQALTLRSIEAHVHGGGDGHEHTACADVHGLDPHIWLSPPLLRTQAQTVADALIAARPDMRETVTTNLQTLHTELDELHASIREALAGLERREFFVFHPAWGYFADAYELRQIPIEVAGREPSDAELTAILELAREHGARVVFVQPQITGKSAQIVANEIGGRVEKIDPLAKDIPENLLHVAKALAEAVGSGDDS